MIIKKFMIFQALELIKKFEKNLDAQPKKKKNKKEATAAPNPK